MSTTAVAAKPKRNHKQRIQPAAPVAGPVAVPGSSGAAVGRLALDALEWLLLFVFYAWFLSNLVGAFREDPANWSCLVVIISESVTVLFLLFRRGSQSISATPGEWLLATVATVLPLLACAGGSSPPALVRLGEVVMLAGMTMLLYAKFTLGRRIGMVPAHRGLALSGAYRFVRHPIYACYIVCHVGVLLRYPTLANFCVYALFPALQIPRLLIEEAHLRRDPEYTAYLTRVRYRLIPGVF